MPSLLQMFRENIGRFIYHNKLLNEQLPTAYTYFFWYVISQMHQLVIPNRPILYLLQGTVSYIVSSTTLYALLTYLLRTTFHRPTFGHKWHDTYLLISSFQPDCWLLVCILRKTPHFRQSCYIPSRLSHAQLYVTTAMCYRNSSKQTTNSF